MLNYRCATVIIAVYGYRWHHVTSKRKSLPTSKKSNTKNPRISTNHHRMVGSKKNNEVVVQYGENTKPISTAGRMLWREPSKNINSFYDHKKIHKS